MAPPPCSHRSTVLALSEELVEEILIRIPPDEPAHLVRAALVCKPWRRIILSGTGFLRRYRAFHRCRPAPLLGFFCNDRDHGVGRPSFMPIGAAFPSLHRPCHCRILDCRHGRVLIQNGADATILMWDPISDDWQSLPQEEHETYCGSYCFVVLCAVAGCFHHDCRGGPFLVVYIGTDDDIDDTILNACVYSSETGAWGTPVSYELNRGCDFNIPHRATVMGDKIYWVFTPGVNIVKYDLVKRSISLLISSPSTCSEASHNLPATVGVPWVLRQTEDGLLGLARIRDSRLYLLSSRMANHDGKLVVEWIQESVIELGKILPIEMNKHSAKIHVSGFAEGVRILFISTRVGTFTLELKSGRVRQITESRDFTAFPFISYFTPSEQLDIMQPQPNPAQKKLCVDSPYI